MPNAFGGEEVHGAGVEVTRQLRSGWKLRVEYPRSVFRIEKEWLNIISVDGMAHGFFVIDVNRKQVVLVIDCFRQCHHFLQWFVHPNDELRAVW